MVQTSNNSEHNMTDEIIEDNITKLISTYFAYFLYILLYIKQIYQ